jgi:hypothetical protein
MILAGFQLVGHLTLLQLAFITQRRRSFNRDEGCFIMVVDTIMPTNFIGFYLS